MSTGEIPAYQEPSLPSSAQLQEDNPRGHVVHFYAEDGFLLDTLGRYVGTALGGGDAAVVIATPAHCDGLWKRLTGRGLDMRAATQQGRYVALDAAETLAKILVGKVPGEVQFLEHVGGAIARAVEACEGRPGHVAAFGEMVALLWAQGMTDAVLRLEVLWNQLMKVHPLSLRCAYPISSFFREEHGDALVKICNAHSGVIPGESYTSLVNEDERLRNITQLQHKAQALETEKAERREIQKSLRMRESELADFLENAVEGVQQVGPDQKILWANKALLELLGYAPEEYVNHSLAEFYPHKESFDDYWQRLMRREDICNFPVDMRCKDGSVKHVLIQSNGVWEGGRFVRTRCFIRDVTEQKLAQQALRDSEVRLRLANDELENQVEQRTATLRRLSAQVLSLQDFERRRIARELHDSLGQYLTALKINVDILKTSPGLSDLWTQAEQLMEQCMTEVRTLSYLLHPPMMDAVGLASAVRWYVNGFAERSGIKVKLDIPQDLPRQPDAVELALFRVLQEGLTNVHRHSGASAAEVSILDDAEELILEVKDNGRGIPPEQVASFNRMSALMGVGLTGMRERVRELGGKMELESNGGGTSLRVTMPVEAEAEDEPAISQRVLVPENN